MPAVCLPATREPLPAPGGDEFVNLPADRPVRDAQFAFHLLDVAPAADEALQKGNALRRQAAKRTGA
jgi:hypothetical protein